MVVAGRPTKFTITREMNAALGLPQTGPLYYLLASSRSLSQVFGYIDFMRESKLSSSSHKDILIPT